MRTSLLVLAVLPVLALVGCGGDSGGDDDGPLGKRSGTKLKNAPEAIVLAEQLEDAGLPLTNVAKQDENTDPHSLLGRPGGYDSRASFDLPGGDLEGRELTSDRGGVIEVFGDPDDAAKRQRFIEETLDGNPILGTQYMYREGPALLRIGGTVAPSTAEPIGKKFEEIAQ